jgi:hypothetical protein
VIAGDGQKKSASWNWNCAKAGCLLELAAGWR